MHIHACLIIYDGQSDLLIKLCFSALPQQAQPRRFIVSGLSNLCVVIFSSVVGVINFEQRQDHDVMHLDHEKKVSPCRPVGEKNPKRLAR